MFTVHGRELEMLDALLEAMLGDEMLVEVMPVAHALVAQRTQERLALLYLCPETLDRPLLLQVVHLYSFLIHQMVQMLIMLEVVFITRPVVPKVGIAASLGCWGRLPGRSIKT